MSRGRAVCAVVMRDWGGAATRRSGDVAMGGARPRASAEGSLLCVASVCEAPNVKLSRRFWASLPNTSSTLQNGWPRTVRLQRCVRRHVGTDVIGSSASVGPTLRQRQ